jgi:hypothetical protein
VLEIDGVKVAIERGHNWELGDRLADRYEEAIELATRTPMTDKVRESVQWRLGFLFEHDGYIFRRLEAEDGSFPFDGVTNAYRSTLNQISYLTRQQGSDTV